MGILSRKNSVKLYSYSKVMLKSQMHGSPLGLYFAFYTFLCFYPKQAEIIYWQAFQHKGT